MKACRRKEKSCKTSCLSRIFFFLGLGGSALVFNLYIKTYISPLLMVGCPVKHLLCIQPDAHVMDHGTQLSNQAVH